MTGKLSGPRSRTRALLDVDRGEMDSAKVVFEHNPCLARYVLIRYSVNLFARMGSMQISATKCLLLSNHENQPLLASELGTYSLISLLAFDKNQFRCELPS